MNKLHVAMVGYLNTLPFEYGLKKLAATKPLRLLLDTPAKCSDYFKEGVVDLALVPVGALSTLDNFEVCLNYGIGCDGPVRTVVLFSNQPLDQIHKIYLDQHSRTSRLLVQLLIEQYQKLQPLYQDRDVEDHINLSEGEAVLMIGDKVFMHEKQYKYTYDLGAMWKEWTGLPFVFAVWIKRNGILIDEDLINTHLEEGIEKIPELIDLYALTASLPHKDISSYINNNLQYSFGKQQRKAVDKFFQLIEKRVSSIR